MADPAPKPRRAGAERVRRVNAHRPAPLTITIIKTWRGHFAWRLAAALRRRAA